MFPARIDLLRYDLYDARMSFENQDYRSILRQAFLERIRANRRYSQRAFARLIALNQSSLSQILSGHKNLSEARAYSVALKLQMPDDERDYFVALVRLEGTQDLEMKRRLREQIDLQFKGKILKVYDLNLDEFQAISDWKHFAVLQLFELKKVKVDETLICKRFEIHPLEAAQIIERLCRLNFIHIAEGRLVRTQGPVVFKTGARLTALTQFYNDQLERAKNALAIQEPTQRIAGSETLAFSEEGLKEARRITDAYLDQLVEVSKKDSKRSTVYQIAVHGFSLEKNLKRRSPK